MILPATPPNRVRRVAEQTTTAFPFGSARVDSCCCPTLPCPPFFPIRTLCDRFQLLRGTSDAEESVVALDGVRGDATILLDMTFFVLFRRKKLFVNAMLHVRSGHARGRAVKFRVRIQVRPVRRVTTRVDACGKSRSHPFNYCIAYVSLCSCCRACN